MRGEYRGVVAVAIVAMIGVLGACTATAEPSPQPTASATADSREVVTTPSPTPTPNLSERGFTEMTVGEPFDVPSQTGDALATFEVTAITVDPACTGSAAVAPANGHFVRVDLTARTAADFSMGDVTIREDMFRVVDASGFTFVGMIATPQAFSCLPLAEQFPLELAPGQELSGSLVVDVPTTSGILIADGFTRGGWEWAYPQ